MLSKPYAYMVAQKVSPENQGAGSRNASSNPGPKDVIAAGSGSGLSNSAIVLKVENYLI